MASEPGSSSVVLTTGLISHRPHTDPGAAGCHRYVTLASHWLLGAHYLASDWLPELVMGNCLGRVESSELSCRLVFAESEL